MYLPAYVQYKIFENQSEMRNRFRHCWRNLPLKYCVVHYTFVWWSVSWFYLWRCQLLNIFLQQLQMFRKTRTHQSLTRTNDRKGMTLLCGMYYECQASTMIHLCLLCLFCQECLSTVGICTLATYYSKPLRLVR